MQKRYKFKYRSKALNTAYVLLQNFAIGLCAVPAVLLILGILHACGIAVTGNTALWCLWSAVFAVFAVFQAIYWLSHKGVTVTDDKVIVDFACIVLPVHTFKKEILIRGIASATLCTQPVSHRVEEVEGGAYNEPYVFIKYGYGGRKEIRLPLQNAEEFIEQINSIKA